MTVLKEYLKRTKDRRGEATQLFISFPPIRAVSKDTIARRVREIMQAAGLDTGIFKPHSIRGASTSAAMRARVPIQTILSTAGWSRQSASAKYYQKPLTSNNFSTSVIEGKNQML